MSLETRKIVRLATFLLLIVPFAYNPTHLVSSSEQASSATPLRVLFIGNSLTYTNDLPALVEAFATASGQRAFAYRSIAFPDFSLEDHWKGKDARKAIAEKKWDYVVLQQGPSASTEGRAVLFEYTRRFAEEIRRFGGRPVLYMVWPSASRLQDFKGVSDSYSQAAENVDGLVFPVGEAWLGAWKLNPSLGLYGGDGFHPSTAGTYLAGLVFYGQLFDRSPLGLPSRVRLASGASIEVPAEQAAMLQQAAEDANKKFARH